jgi:hypothetical protein
MFPIIKRHSESLALGFIASRVLESTIIVVGIISVLSVVTLRKDIGGAGAADPASLILAGRSLVAIHRWTFLLGPGVCAGLGNGLLLGWLMYRSELVPRRMALLGLLGGPLLLGSCIAVLFGAFTQTSGVAGVLTIPEFLWELSLGVFLIARGFNTSSPVLETRPTQGTGEVLAPAVARA